MTDTRIQALIDEQGLQRAATLFPEVVAAAAAKARMPLATDIPPLTVPVMAFYVTEKDKAS
jgi:hypothetical protein